MTKPQTSQNPKKRITLLLLTCLQTTLSFFSFSTFFGCILFASSYDHVVLFLQRYQKNKSAKKQFWKKLIMQKLLKISFITPYYKFLRKYCLGVLGELEPFDLPWLSFFRADRAARTDSHPRSPPTHRTNNIHFPESRWTGKVVVAARWPRPRSQIYH